MSHEEPRDCDRADDSFPGWGTLGGKPMDRSKLKPCDIPNCSWCKEEVVHNLTGETKFTPELLEQWLVERKKLADTLGPPSSWGGPLADLMTKPNRFDPYEALDQINTYGQSTSTKDYEMILHWTRALRAYITGRER